MLPGKHSCTQTTSLLKHVITWNAQASSAAATKLKANQYNFVTKFMQSYTTFNQRMLSNKRTNLVSSLGKFFFFFSLHSFVQLSAFFAFFHLKTYQVFQVQLVSLMLPISITETFMLLNIDQHDSQISLLCKMYE